MNSTDLSPNSIASHSSRPKPADRHGDHLKADFFAFGIDLKKKSEIHLARKIWHMSSVGLMAAIYAYAPEKVSLSILAFGWLVLVPLDIFRHFLPSVNEVMVHLFRPVMRESELNKIAGTSYLLTGVAAVAFLFQREVVLLTLLFLAFADPIASYFGIKYGKDKLFGHKSLQGTFAAFVVCTLLSYAFFYTHDLMQDRWVVVSLLAGLIGALAELIPIGKLDDNLTLPVLSSIFLWALFSLFGVLP